MNSSEDFLRSQYVTLEKERGKHRKYLPYEKNEPVAYCDRFKIKVVEKAQGACTKSLQGVNDHIVEVNEEIKYGKRTTNKQSCGSMLENKR